MRSIYDQCGSQHLYSYTGNNPINYVDPTGHWGENINWGKIVTGALIVGVAVVAVATVAVATVAVGSVAAAGAVAATMGAAEIAEGFKGENPIKDVMGEDLYYNVTMVSTIYASMGAAYLYQLVPTTNSSSNINSTNKKPTVVNGDETKAPNTISAEEATNQWDDYLGTETNNINPVTGASDPNRIFSYDSTKSIRFGMHEMESMSTTKAHYHIETWSYNSSTNTYTVTNILQRVR